MAGCSNRTRTGEGAKEKVIDYFNAFPRAGRASVGHLIKYLDDHGFIIVPKGHSAPARRGNSKKPPVYTGPELIGKSHAARLVGG